MARTKPLKQSRFNSRPTSDRKEMILSRIDAEAFFDALAHPPTITGELAAALKEHERRVSWE